MVEEGATRMVTREFEYVIHFLRTEKSALFSRFFLGNIQKVTTLRAFYDPSAYGAKELGVQ